MKVDPNAPAYPHSITRQNDDGSKTVTTYHGLTARLAIAAQIMAGFAANSCLSETWIAEGRTVSEMANDAQSWADALIAAHNEDSK